MGWLETVLTLALTAAAAWPQEQEARAAIARCREAIRKDPERLEPYLRAGRLLLAAKDSAAAIALLETAPPRVRGEAAFLFLLGRAYFAEAERLRGSPGRRRGAEIRLRLVDARRTLEAALRRAPEDAEVAYTLAQVLLALEPPAAADALRALNRAEKACASRPAFHRSRAQALLQLRRWRQAAAAFLAASEREPHWRRALADRLAAAQAWHAAGADTQALEALAAAHRAAPEATAPFETLWRLWAGSEAGRRQALAFLNQLEERSTSPLVPYYRGHLLLLAGQAAAAATAFEKVVRHPRGRAFSEAWARLAWCRRTTAPAAAVAAAAEALRRDPGNATAYAVLQHLVAGHYRARHLAEAERLTRIILRYRPREAVEWANLGLFLRDQGRYEAARAAYEKAVALAPEAAQILNDAAVVLHYHLGRTEEAERLYRRALAADPDTVDAWENLGVILWERGERAAARRCFAEVLKRQPGRAKAARYLEEIERATPPRKPRPPGR